MNQLLDYLALHYRYNSFSTINKIQTAPTIQSLDDSAIIRKYGSRAGWNANRTYSIVVAPNKGYTCGLFNEADDLFLTTTAADGVIANQWAILDRQLVPKFTRDGQPDRSITYARTKCGKMGDDLACVKPDVLRGLLGDYYPCEYPISLHACLASAAMPRLVPTIDCGSLVLFLPLFPITTLHFSQQKKAVVWYTCDKSGKLTELYTQTLMEKYFGK